MTTMSKTETVTLDELVLAHEQMFFIRLFEERCEQLFRDTSVRGSMHLYAGQEAVAAGTCANLVDGDVLAFTYRSHGWALARGIEPERVLGECLGREGGTSRGRGGSKHISDWVRRRVMPSNAIVAAHLPLATGAAWALKRQNSQNIAVAAFGDGATNQGAFHEALTMAKLWELPILFVCENNQYGEMSAVEDMLPTATLADRAYGHGVLTYECDGMDYLDVRKVTRDAIQEIRRGGGPAFVLADTYRFSGHMTGDPEKYRTAEEKNHWRLRDPIKVLHKAIVDRGGDSDALEAVRGRMQDHLEQVEEIAKSMPYPAAGEISFGAQSWARITRDLEF